MFQYSFEYCNFRAYKQYHLLQLYDNRGVHCVDYMSVLIEKYFKNIAFTYFGIIKYNT
jgi:hypothetical protein